MVQNAVHIFLMCANISDKWTSNT